MAKLHKSAVAEHSVNSGHRFLFHYTSILATKTRYMVRNVREAIETELHSNNIFCIPILFAICTSTFGKLC
jgi:hypothetical protein